MRSTAITEYGRHSARPRNLNGPKLHCAEISDSLLSLSASRTELEYNHMKKKVS